MLRGLFYEANAGAGAGGAAPVVVEAGDPPAPPVAAAPAAPAVDPELERLRLENVRLLALADFPQADREVLMLVTGSAEEIRAAAQRLHERAQVPAPAQPSGAGPAPVPGSGVAVTPEDAEVARLRTLARQVRDPRQRKRVDPIDAEDVRDDGFARGWNNLMQLRRRAAGVSQ